MSAEIEGSTAPAREPPQDSKLRASILPSWMGRELTIIFSARVLMSGARALAGIIAPIYLALEGFNAFSLGLLFLSVALVSALLSSAVGVLSDKVGRKAFLVVLPFFATVAGISFALSRDAAVLVVTASLGSFGRGAGAGAGAIGPYQPAETALVSEVTEGSQRNAAFGRLAFGSSIGALAGSLLALLVDRSHVHGAEAMRAFAPAFLATAGLAAIAGLLALALHEPERPKTAGGERRRVRFPSRSRPLLYRLWATNGVNGLAIGMFGPFITYWLYARYGASAAEIGVLYAVINAFTAISTLSAAGLARRFGLIKTVTAVRVAQAVLLVPMVLSPSFALAGAIYLVRMVVQRIGLPLRQSYVVAMADPDERASVTALSNLPSQGAMAASPVLAGYLFESVSLELPFEMAGALQLINALMYWAFFRRLPPLEEQLATTTVVAAGAPAASASAGERPARDGGAPGNPPSG